MRDIVLRFVCLQRFSRNISSILAAAGLLSGLLSGLFFGFVSHSRLTSSCSSVDFIYKKILISLLTYVLAAVRGTLKRYVCAVRVTAHMKSSINFCL